MTCFLHIRADVNIATDDEMSPLHAAAEFGGGDMVKLLLAHPASVDAVSGSGETPLYFAAQNGHTGAVQALLQANADVTRANLSFE